MQKNGKKPQDTVSHQTTILCYNKALVTRGSAKSMPYVNVQITKGATRAQKAELVKDITDDWQHQRAER